MPQQAPPALALVATAAARAAQPPPYSPSDPYPSPCASPRSSILDLPFPTSHYPSITPGAPPTPPATPRTGEPRSNHSPSHTRPRHSPPPLDLSLPLGHPDEYPPAPLYDYECPVGPSESECRRGWERNIDLDIDALPPSPQLSAALRDLRHSHNPAMWGTRKPRRIRMLDDSDHPGDYADGVWGWVCWLFEQLAGPVPPPSPGRRGGGGAAGRTYAYAAPAGFLGFGAHAPV